MAIKMHREVAVPEGKNTGIITAARETTKDFGEGPEASLEILIKPDYKVEGARTLDLSVLFSPVLNGMSALDGLLDRFHIEVNEGETFNVAVLKDKKVSFVTKRNAKGFVQVQKDSINPI